MSDNPYAAPRSEELLTRSGVSLEQARATRQHYRGVERLVRSIGLVYFVQALCVVLLSFMLLTSGIQQDATSVLSAAIYCFVLALVLMVAGFGLRQLAHWSRLAALLQTFYLLGGFMFGLFALTIDGRAGFVFAMLHALPFYVLFSPRAGFVLSRTYKDVMAATPGESPGSWLLAMLIIALLAALVAADYQLFSWV
jgi:dolichyl-phosphate-mannose--protein O-mannosyl transferase